MRNETLTQVSETEALHIVLCINDETVASGHCNTQDVAHIDYASDAIRAMRKIFPEAEADTEPNFSKWNGGTYSRKNLGWGKCFIGLRTREIAKDEDGETIEGDWVWTDESRASAESRAIAEKLASAANQAIADAIGKESGPAAMAERNPQNL